MFIKGTSLAMYNSGLYSLILIFVSALVINQSASCTVGLNTYGKTIPHGDIIIEYGHPLEIYCVLNEEYVLKHGEKASENIQFTRKNVVVQDMVEIINASTARLYIEKPPMSDSMYHCIDKTTEAAICLNTVIVGSSPQDVINFTCIGRNYINLNCSWITPKNYVNTNYSLSYYFGGRSSRMTFSCPEIKPTLETADSIVQSCFWDLSTEPQYRQAQHTYYFTLVMNNIFGNRSFRYNFSHFANVIPDPPQNLTIISKTSESIYLSWVVPIAMKNFPPGLEQKVIYQSEYEPKDSNWQVANVDKLNAKNFSHYFNLTNLKYAHAIYDIRISMRSMKASDNDKMWSDHASITTRTESKIPDMSPRTNIGSFETVLNSEQGRDVYVYWQYIEDHMKNGENCTYQVIEVLENNNLINIKPNETTRSYAKYIGLKRNMKYKFSIATVNEIGPSKNSSVIYVPEVNKVPEPTGFTKIEFDNGTYELSWVAPTLLPHHNPIVNYTIFYCKNAKDRPHQCEGYLNWTVVSGNLTAYNVTVRSDKIYQFAISANTRTASSGMVWASCTVINKQGSGKVRSLWISYIGSTFIVVNWKLDCSDRIGNPEGFDISYCPIVSPVDRTCKDIPKSTFISSSKEFGQANVTSLTPYTTYQLTVQVRTKHGNSFQSEPLYNTTLEDVPDVPQNVSIKRLTNSSVTVEWFPPIKMNGVLRFYEIIYQSEYDRKPNFIKIESNVDVNTNSTMKREATLNNLTGFTEYQINITACTVECSRPSKPLSVKTEISEPGIMHIPLVTYPNASTIRISWDALDFKNRGGNIDYYQLQIKQKTSSGNKSEIIDTKDLRYDLSNCKEGDNYKIYFFSIRAVNIYNNTAYQGKWSQESQHYCQASPKLIYWIWLAILVGICTFGILLFCALKKIWERFQVMRDVGIKLPPGLAPPVDANQLHHWPSPNQKTHNDDTLRHMRTDTSTDEELLLDKKIDNLENRSGIIGSGDSSGCSSGQESVTSSLASGTNLDGCSTLDSGTEQPKTPSSESVNGESSSLRLRKTGSESGNSWNTDSSWPNKKGYVTMPYIDKPTTLEKPTLSLSSWATKKSLPSSNYCVLGVNSTPSPESEICGYVPVPKNIPDEYKKGSYIKSFPFIPLDSNYTQIDSGHTQPPYVITVDTNNLITRDKNHAYGTGEYSVLPTNKLPEPTNNSYMQMPFGVFDKKLASTADNNKLFSIESASKSVEDDMPIYDKTENILNNKIREMAELKSDYLASDAANSSSDQLLNSYCRLGWDSKKNNLGRGSLDLSDELLTTVNDNEDCLAMPSKPVQSLQTKSPTKGYVPHRHFENKVLKED